MFIYLLYCCFENCKLNRLGYFPTPALFAITNRNMNHGAFLRHRLVYVKNSNNWIWSLSTKMQFEPWIRFGTPEKIKGITVIPVSKLKFEGDLLLGVGQLLIWSGMEMYVRTPRYEDSNYGKGAFFAAEFKFKDLQEYIKNARASHFDCKKSGQVYRQTSLLLHAHTLIMKPQKRSWPIFTMIIFFFR